MCRTSDLEGSHATYLFVTSNDSSVPQNGILLLRPSSACTSCASIGGGATKIAPNRSEANHHREEDFEFLAFGRTIFYSSNSVRSIASPNHTLLIIIIDTIWPMLFRFLGCYFGFKLVFKFCGSTLTLCCETRNCLQNDGRNEPAVTNRNRIGEGLLQMLIWRF